MKPVGDCPFCAIWRGEAPAQVHLRSDAGGVMAIRPLNPATNGHVLVIPRRHVELWPDLTPNEMASIGVTALTAANILRHLDPPPEGFNLIASAGAAATQTVPHVHFHVVPRYRRDRMGRIWPRRRWVA